MPEDEEKETIDELISRLDKILESSDDEKDKRKFERHSAKFKVRFQKSKTFSSKKDPNIYSGIVKDLSRGGMSIYTKTELIRGEEIRVMLYLPNQNREIEAIAKVVRSQKISGGMYSLGLKFKDIESF